MKLLRALTVAVAGACMLTAGELRRPNILFFLADDLGQRDLACYGSTFHETPHLDSLARDGARFSDAYAAAPVCSPSRAAVLTGKYPARLGLTDIVNAVPPAGWSRNTRLLPAPTRDRLPLDEMTLARLLAAAGYATFFAGKWHLGPEGCWPEDHGFERNLGGTGQAGPYGGGRYFSPYANPRLPDGPPGEHLPDRLARESAQFIADQRTRPFFAFLAFYSVHTPLMARDDLRRKYEVKRARLGLQARFGREGPRDVRLVQEHPVFAAMVEAMDLAVGKVLAELDAHGLRDDTIVIFTSDNGGLSTAEGWPTSNHPLRAGKGWLHEGGLRVPLIVRWPDVTRPGAIIDTPVSGVDFLPTIAALAGRPIPARVDGIDFRPVLRGERHAPERPLFWHYPHYGNQGGAPGSVVRAGDWKLIEWQEDGRRELYHLRDDVGETTDRSSQQPELTARLAAQLAEWRRRQAAAMPAANPNYDPTQPDGRAAPRPRVSESK